MAGNVETLRLIARAPLRTMRYSDLKGLDSNAWRRLDDLVARGAIARLAHGVYAVPPNGIDAREWRPGLESTALAIATARHGDRRAVLMGIGAARHHGAIPRAIGSTAVAVPTKGQRPLVTDAGRIHFIPRELSRIEAVLEQTELGPALVSTPEQALFDLLMSPHQGGDPDVAVEASQQILPQVDHEEFEQIVARAAKVNDAVREAERKFGEQR